MPSAGGHCGNAAMLAIDEDTVALLSKKIALSEIAHEALVDGRSAHRINVHGVSFACRLTTGFRKRLA